jgi:glyoxylase-like metal-dependent hydrolase (beta-lactamase superfamily II)
MKVAKNFKKPASIAVSVYAAEEADVNAFVLADPKGTFIIDCTRNSNEAKKAADLARSKGKTPKLMLITHGHPDHYMGMAQMKKEFPGLRIVVANRGIKDDIISFSNWMESVGWLENEPEMKPKSEKHPGGFDYQKEIEVLNARQIQLPGGAILELKSHYAPTEAPHETTVYSNDLNAVFVSDLAYNQVHLWMGIGVPTENVANWKQALSELEATYAGLNAKVYPGHGQPTDVSVFAEVRKYIDVLLQVVSETKTEDEAKTKMVALYPTYRNADFLLVQSIKFQMTQLKR